VHLVEAGPDLSKIQAKKLSDGPEATMDPMTGAATSLVRSDGLRIEWYGDLTVVPKDRWSFTIAHEFFDALPVHKFELTDKGWREIMVDIDQDPNSTFHFRYVLATKSTGASTALLSPPERFKEFKLGDRIEISPETYRYGNELAKRIHGAGGTALIIDYGRDHISSNSLRVR
jgi:NADH dehydrogenase [ubiquinone] 1 alpha subcomplex assembly factor 7